MILTVDIGNTKTNLVLFLGQTVKLQKVITTSKNATVDEIKEFFSWTVYSMGVKWTEIEAVVVSCVVPVLVTMFSLAIKQINNNESHNAKFVFLDNKSVEVLDKSLYDISFPNKDEVAPDYIAAVIGAKKMMNGSCIVADLGTATNLALIDNFGKFYAGIIMPGLETSIKALISDASSLADFVIEEPKTVAGYNTNECLNSGLVFGEAAKIDGLIDRIIEEQGYNSQVIMTGGWAPMVSKKMNHEIILKPNLIPEGLLAFYNSVK